MAATVKIKEFQSALGSPLATPDGTSIEELVNAFIVSITPSNLLDVIRTTTQTGKYGTATTFFATVVYKS